MSDTEKYIGEFKKEYKKEQESLKERNRVRRRQALFIAGVFFFFLVLPVVWLQCLFGSDSTGGAVAVTIAFFLIMCFCSIMVSTDGGNDFPWEL